MRFHKLNGAGNDFIIINNLEEHIPVEAFSAIAAKICHRHLSIGADGLMVVDRSDVADYKMLFYNSDGSPAEMCGNGARCICRYGNLVGLSGEEQVVETPSGIVRGKRITERIYRIRLTDPTVIDPEFTLKVDGEEYRCGYVELGNPGLPHAVVYIPDLAQRESKTLFDLGRKLRFHQRFPKGANVNFYDKDGDAHVTELTYERGVEDFTFACGTGTASIALVLAQRGEGPDSGLDFDMPGGRLNIDIVRKDDGSVDGVWLTGPTNVVCVGEVRDEELDLRKNIWRLQECISLDSSLRG